LVLHRRNTLKAVVINNRPVAVALLFGVGLGLALKSILLGIMFGIIFYVALKEDEKRQKKKRT
jgi:hypothetical protein|tara:strand:- start:178 stop:366 length:189 start_codon:yes stop_codon:yes gene_type:complete